MPIKKITTMTEVESYINGYKNSSKREILSCLSLYGIERTMNIVQLRTRESPYRCHLMEWTLSDLLEWCYNWDVACKKLRR